MNNGQYVTIQKTSKNIKAIMGVSTMLFIASPIVVTMSESNVGMLVGGFMLPLLGLTLNITGRIMRWWNHD